MSVISISGETGVSGYTSWKSKIEPGFVARNFQPCTRSTAFTAVSNSCRVHLSQFGYLIFLGRNPFLISSATWACSCKSRSDGEAMMRSTELFCLESETFTEAAVIYQNLSDFSRLIDTKKNRLTNYDSMGLNVCCTSYPL